jgi:5-(carboxyamino)imidazole ribonucleotide synthase
VSRPVHAPLPPGSVVGILGGGQLGRMLALAAARLGLRAHIFCESPDEPALEVARHFTIAPFDDEAALALFAGSVDVATYEFENVPAETAATVAAHGLLLPDARVLATTQDRLFEKTALRDLGIPLASFAPVHDRASLAAAVGAVGRPSVLKTRRFGYDGKGQVTVREGLSLDAALSMIGGQPAVLEAFVPFRIEVSVVAARSRSGAFAAFEVTENRHAHHILRSSHVPAAITPAIADEAVAMAERFAAAFDYVGVFAVEMFVVEQDGRERVLANEIAPRVHNSGHWTLDGADTSQFEQHIRAICGWPLGSTRRRGDRVEMRNLLGDEANGWRDIAAAPGVQLHLYGKGEARPGRKMGHLTIIDPQD